MAGIDHGRRTRRCLPYGDGVTYWPVAQVLKQLDELPADEGCRGSHPFGAWRRRGPTSSEEIAWAFRKALEGAARDRPLVVVLDDIQWGEETFLDLIEHVALLSSGASILLLCMARPELVERRPTWPATFRLEPLDDDDVDQLVPDDIPGSSVTRSLAPRGAIPSSSRRWWRWPARSATRWSFPHPCEHCSRHAWINSVRPNGACSNEVRSRVRSFTAARFKR